MLFFLLPGSGWASDEHGDLFSNLNEPNFDCWAMERFVLADGTRYFEWRFPSPYRRDENQGKRIVPKSQIRHITRTQSQIIYDVRYTIDEHGVRWNPQKTSLSENSVSLLGCSITFGIGLDDSETIAAFLAQELPNTSVFNRGHPGIGTNLLLAQAEESFFQAEEKFSKKSFVYVIAEPLHTNRNAGKIPAISWSAVRPYYYLKDGELVREGSFSSGRPITTWIYSQLKSIFEFIGLGQHYIFPPLTQKDFKLTCELGDELRLQILKHHPNSNFMVYIFGPAKSAETSIKCFTQKSISYLKSKMPLSDDYFISSDSHPNAKATQFMAKELATYFQRK